MKRLILLIVIAYCMTAAAPPVSPIRRDESFWNMLSPVGRERLSEIILIVRDTCEGTVVGSAFLGGRFDQLTDTIEFCGSIGLERDRVRHEALHALDWNGTQMISVARSLAKFTPADLYAEAERIYRCTPGPGCHGWFRPGELYATLPIVVGWDFGMLPPEVAKFYSPWFRVIPAGWR